MLRSVPVMEADRLITVLTPSLGKLRATVRGARKVTSRLGGHVDVLNRVQLSLAHGRTFEVVTGADALESHRVLKSDLDRVALALYLVELTDAMVLEDDPHPSAYRLLLDALGTMNSVPPSPVVPRYVELHLLAEAGYLPELGHCLVCGSEVSAGHHRYAPGLGGLVCDTCSVAQGLVFPLSVDALKVLRFFARSTFAEALRMHIKPGLAAELEALLGASIHHVLERDVASSAFVEHLRRLRVRSTSAAPPPS